MHLKNLGSFFSRSRLTAADLVVYGSKAVPVEYIGRSISRNLQEMFDRTTKIPVKIHYLRTEPAGRYFQIVLRIDKIPDQLFGSVRDAVERRLDSLNLPDNVKVKMTYRKENTCLSKTIPVPLVAKNQQFRRSKKAGATGKLRRTKPRRG